MVYSCRVSISPWPTKISGQFSSQLVLISQKQHTYECTAEVRCCEYVCHHTPFPSKPGVRSLSLQFCGRRLDGISPCETPTCQPLVIRCQINNKQYIIYIYALLCIYVKCAVCAYVLNDMIYVIFWRSAMDWVGEDDLTTPLRHAQPSRSVWKWTTEHWPKSCVRKVEMRLKRSRRLPKRLGVPSEAWHPPKFRNGNPWV